MVTLIMLEPRIPHQVASTRARLVYPPSPPLLFKNNGLVEGYFPYASRRSWKNIQDPMKSEKDKQDQVHTRDSAKYGSADDDQYIVRGPVKVSSSSEEILQEIKVRRAEALRLLADH